MSNFAMTAASGSVTAGQTDNLAITAQDAWDNTVTSYTGSHQPHLLGRRRGSAPTTRACPTAAVRRPISDERPAINFTAGVATVTGANNGVMTLYRAETAHVVVSDGHYSNGSGLAITVGPGA